MAIEIEPLNEQAHKAIIGLCILAAFADGTQAEVERAQIERIVQGFSREHIDLTSAYQDVLGGQLTLAQMAAQLPTASARALAYEMASCVCHADGILKEPEKQFLADLRQALQLDSRTAEACHQDAEAIIAQPLAAPPPAVINVARDADTDRVILNTAILAGALEIMPHTLATMAIVPVQMRMVYQIGKRYGFELDRGHVADFLATAGVGLTSQVFEGVTQRVVGGLARRLAGRLLGGLVGQAAGSAFAFATTYALGQVAKRYYSGGRTLTTAQLKETFSSMLTDARSLQGRYSGDIAEKARGIRISDLVPMARGNG